MRLEYICHSCFAIDVCGKTIVFDPWITGTAYNGRWHLFPKPVDISRAISADVICISHGHNDHLHNDSLKLINKNAHIFFPYQWRKGIRSYFKHAGFSKITEAVSFHTYELAREIKITYLGYSLESVIVIEAGGKILVNINDALNSNHENAVNFLLHKIKERWQRIDYLLSGWSGAGYFPNKVKFSSKNDVEVGKIREQYFANNFCRFTKFLNPRIAIAFAPGFALLQEENRWINHLKFPRQQLNRYYRDYFDKETKIKFPILYPGDYIESDESIRFSSSNSDDMLYDKLEKEFESEIKESNSKRVFPEVLFANFLSRLNSQLEKNKHIYPKPVLKDVIFSIQLKDISQNSFLNVTFCNGRFRVTRSNNMDAESKLLISTEAALLMENFKKPWGGDLLSIGYGITVEVFDELSLEKNLDIVCVRLISSFPQTINDMPRNFNRMIKYYFSNPEISLLWLKQKTRLKPYVNKFPFNERDHWISFNKCDLCKVCNLPQLDFRRGIQP